MHPSGRTATDLNEYPLSLVDLREDGGSPSENRENGFVGRRSRAKVDTGATNDPSTSVARHDLGLVEDRLGNASRAIDNKECRAKATFVDLALRFDELDSRILDFGVPPRRTRRCAFDLDACRRQRRDGVGAGMATRPTPTRPRRVRPPRSKDPPEVSKSLASIAQRARSRLHESAALVRH